MRQDLEPESDLASALADAAEHDVSFRDRGHYVGELIDEAARRRQRRARLQRFLDLQPPPVTVPGPIPRIVDTTSESALADAFTAYLTSDRELEHVVAIAGRALPGDGGTSGFEMPDPTVFHDSVDLNLVGPYCLVHAALPWLRQSMGNRTIGLCTSINAFGAWARPTYSAAKAGLVGLNTIFSDSLATEAIRVNTVTPGSVASPEGSVGRERDPAVIRELLDTMLLGRVATPEDIVGCFVTLALDLRHVTGQVLVADGGQNRHRRRHS